MTSAVAPARGPVVLGPGGYRLGTILATAVVALVFGGLWLVVLIDTSGGGTGGARLIVMSALGLGLPLTTWVGLSALNRRARRLHDFDTIDPGAPRRLVFSHSFTGARVELPTDGIEAWLLVEAPPARAGEMGTFWLEVRRRQGAPLRSEPHATPDRLLRGLASLGVTPGRLRAGEPGQPRPLR